MEFKKNKDAKEALETMDGQIMDEKPLKICFYLENLDKSHHTWDNEEMNKVEGVTQ